MELPSFRGSSSIAFSPDGNYVATASHLHVRAWDLHSGQEVLVWNYRPRERTTGLSDLAFSPDGSLLAVAAGYDDCVVLLPFKTLLSHKAP